MIVQVKPMIASYENIFGRASTTSCPRSRSACAAVSAAVRHSSSTGSPVGASRSRPILSRPGSAPTSSMYGRSGSGALYQASRSARPMTSSMRAASPTVRVIAPPVVECSQPRTNSGTRPRLGLRPTRPVTDAGTRIDPPPSPACATGASPAATAADAPPLDPPEVCARFHGLRVLPCRAFSETVSAPNSGEFVRPRGIAPASRRSWTSGSVTVCGVSRIASEDIVLGCPARELRSLMGMGTPCSGPSGAPLSTALSALTAAARTASVSSQTTALTAGLIRSMRSR